MTGAEIKALRKKVGLSQEKFAFEIGVTQTTVNRWELGKAEPSSLALAKLRNFDFEAKVRLRNLDRSSKK